MPGGFCRRATSVARIIAATLLLASLSQIGAGSALPAGSTTIYPSEKQPVVKDLQGRTLKVGDVVAILTPVGHACSGTSGVTIDAPGDTDADVLTYLNADCREIVAAIHTHPRDVIDSPLRDGRGEFAPARPGV